MKVYLDIFTGDELSSDSYPMKLVDDVYYEFEGKVRATGDTRREPFSTSLLLEHRGIERHR